MEWTDEKVRRYWDYISLSPEHYFTYQVGGRLAAALKKYIRPGKELLDYGSGPGFLIRHLLDRGINVTALEFSTNSLDQIRKTYAGKSGFRGAYSIEELQERKEKFDLITLIEVIEHLDDRYLELTFSNIKNLLAADGILVVTTPNEEILENSYILNPETNELFHRWQHVRRWDRQILGDFVTGEGFRVIEIGATNFNLSPLRKLLRLPKKTLKKILGMKSSKDQPHLYCVCSLT